MHDNSLARALRELGTDCLLQPVYTPIRTDDISIASPKMFFGGVHVYLLQRFPILRWIPGPIRRLLDQTAFLSWATRRAGSTDAGQLGDLAVAMLRGEHGALRDEFSRLTQWLRDDIRPDAVILTNLLIGGCIPSIKREIPGAKVMVILQGDDTFLDHLPVAHREAAIDEMSKLGDDTDLFIVNSEFYGKKMASMLRLELAKFRVLPLSIDTSAFNDWTSPPQRSPVTIGYLARIAPEKGTHVLVTAFIELAKRPGCEDVRLCMAGWLGAQNEAYLASIMDRVRRAGLSHRVEYRGSPDLAGKLQLLRDIDILSVPTEHEEPKGLFVLEALAAGVPVVQPAIGAFPEVIGSTGGGILVAPSDPIALADGLEQLVNDPLLRSQLGEVGRLAVMTKRTTLSQAAAMIELLADTVPGLPTSRD